MNLIQWRRSSANFNWVKPITVCIVVIELLVFLRQPCPVQSLPTDIANWHLRHRRQVNSHGEQHLPDKVEFSEKNNKDGSTRRLRSGLTKAMEMFQNLRRMLSERMLLSSSLADEHHSFTPAADSPKASKRGVLEHAELNGHSQLSQDAESTKRTIYFDPNPYGSLTAPTPLTSSHRHRHSKSHHHQHANNYPSANLVHAGGSSATDQTSQTGLLSGKVNMGEFRINANLHLSSDLDNSEDDNRPSWSSKSNQRLNFLDVGREAERKLQAAVNLAGNSYDCPRVHGKITQLLCPSRRLHGYRVCIDESALCNGRPDCPYGEDEDAVSCLFYKTTMRYFKTVVDTVVELTDVMFRQRKSVDEL
ncbi:hypothetical protein T4E_789 [Trichinella pseudospiralis]|uniref:Uncharacterized protein n=1 Tax=Trichinella pseudospiralis TaxID=6337 RepID=A0A0V0Y5A7_TRIPS|nr:hypothetical protein T4E_4993 [Trichinella pseudospiralis]KRX95396.1 hypothetical protein T4E_789 [Trichinella pseudospiralis]